MKTTQVHHDPLLDDPVTGREIGSHPTDAESAFVIAVRAPIQPEETADFLDRAIVLARHKWSILAIIGGFTVVALLVALLIPVRYTASARFLPPQQNQSASAALLTQLAGSGLGSLASVAGKDLGIKNPNDVYLGVLKSRTVEDALISHFNLLGVYREKRLSDARKELEKRTDIVPEKEGLVSISVEDKDPKRAAAMANAYVDELRNVTQHLAIGEASQRRFFFEQQMKQAKDDLGNAEVALKETEQKTGMIQLDSQAKAVIEAIGNLRAQIAAKEVQLQAMRSYATVQNPQYIISEQQLSGLRTQLAKLEDQSGGGKGDPILSTGNVPSVALEYIRRLRDVKYYETIFDLLAKQYEAAKIDEAREAAMIQVVDPAVQPDRRSSPKYLFILTIGIILGCLSSTGWCLFVDHLQMNPRSTQKLRLLRKYIVGEYRNA